MAAISKPIFQQRLDEIKSLILSKSPFQTPLARLYENLRLSAKYRWALQAYQLLLLYVPDAEHTQLYHPALLQAFFSLGMYRQAHQCAQELLRQTPNDPEVKKLLTGLKIRTESTLPHYTALATLSQYAVSSAPSKKCSKHTLPATWQHAWRQITPEKLDELGYYQKQKQLAKIRTPRRQLIQEQFDELMLNYLLGHIRSVVVLSGSLLEILLALHLQQVTNKTHLAPTGQKQKAILDLNLSELLTIYAQKNLLPAHLLHLCRAARLKRNYIHIGKEILEQNRLLAADAKLCVVAVLETIDILCPAPKKV